ncbi:MAG: FAD-dependent oxidoreductase [Myxococcales bacterium]|nr:MAG: FAD-dependent oxidoreductase [Myxococcales bacterium]
MTLEAPEQRLQADVLVIGGGPAGTWAAVTAAREGARVVLVDKGYCGASGVAATAGVGHWLVPPDGALREEAMRQRARSGGGLTDRDWQARVLHETWERLGELASLGYPQSQDGQGRPVLRIGQAPQYLKFMRDYARRQGVRILDHAPALELLTGGAEVRGARGYRLQSGDFYEVRSGAVVLASGGCTWKSKSLGGDVNTGDGHLMAAELGAELSGMEFSSFYGIVPKSTTMDKNGYYGFATFTREDGSVVEGALFSSRLPLLQASLQGPLYAQFDRAPRDKWQTMRAAMPNFFMVMDKLRCDPFTQRFAIDFVLEGTVRGTGGVRLVDEACATGVPGLYAAGDVASREIVVGGATGAGAPNAAWAVASGIWSGRAATHHARSSKGGAGALGRGSGQLGLRPSGSGSEPQAWRELLKAVQNEILPIEKNALRSRPGLERSLIALQTLYLDARAHLHGSGRDLVRARETASMLMMARWAYESALARNESRGMHARIDYPRTDPLQQHRIVCRGLEHIRTSVDSVRPRPAEGWLAA